MNAYRFTDEDELSVPPLNKKEKAWVKKLQKVLSECPDRLECVVMGDPTVQIIDVDGGRESELSDGAAMRDGIVLATCFGKPAFQGVSE